MRDLWVSLSARAVCLLSSGPPGLACGCGFWFLPSEQLKLESHIFPYLSLPLCFSVPLSCLPTYLFVGFETGFRYVEFTEFSPTLSSKRRDYRLLPPCLAPDLLLKTCVSQAREMAQSTAALAENSGYISRTHMVAHNHLTPVQGTRCPLLVPGASGTHGA